MSDDPPCLTVGTEVSAKFKGAFCEAKIKKVSKSVKARMVLKEPPFGPHVTDITDIKTGVVELNAIVEVAYQKTTISAQILGFKDYSSYHVVFNDGDEKTLRRTQLCLKSGKHFDEKASLDVLPLYNPEQWINNPDLHKNADIMPKELIKKLKRRKMGEESPQKRKRKKEGDDSDDEGSKKREKRAAASAANVAIEEMDQGDTEISCDGSSSGDASDVEKEKEKERKKQEMERREKEKSVAWSPEDKTKEKFHPGDLVAYYEDSCKTKWSVGIIVSVKAYRGSDKKGLKNPVPVRLFTSGKYIRVPGSQLQQLEEMKLTKKQIEGFPQILKTSVEKAMNLMEKDQLPPQWKWSDIYDENEPPKSLKRKNEKDEKKKEKERNTESESSSSEESEEDENDALERDHFVARLYKFQEDRGTPINRAPVLGGKEIDLFRFHRIVKRYGGEKRVTTNSEWKRVLVRMKLEGCPGATPVTVRKAYTRYLSHFNDIDKSLEMNHWLHQSTSGGGESSRDKRLLMRVPTDDKKKRSTPTTTTAKKKDPGDKESTVEKESSVESKDDKKDKEKKEKKLERSEKSQEREKKEECVKKEEEKKKSEKKVVKKEEKKVEKKEKKKEEEDEDEGEGSQRDENGQPMNNDKKSVGPKYGKGPKGFLDGDEDSSWNVADIFTEFKLGRDLRAWHCGKWYDARIVQTNQLTPKELLVKIKQFENNSTLTLNEELKGFLSKAMTELNVLVHYLGWNSRYDEFVGLAKLKAKVHEQEESMQNYRLINSQGINIAETFLQKIMEWVKGPEGIGSLKKEEPTNNNFVGIGGYRPRRVSVSQYEQIQNAVIKAKSVDSNRSRFDSTASSTIKEEDEDDASTSTTQKEDMKKMEQKEEDVQSVTSASSSLNKIEIKKEEIEKAAEPTPINSPRPKRQRTVSANSNRTNSPATLATPPITSAAPTPPAIATTIRPGSPSKPISVSTPVQIPPRPTPTVQSIPKPTSVQAGAKQPTTVPPILKQTVQPPKSLAEAPLVVRPAKPKSPEKRPVEVKEEKIGKMIDVKSVLKEPTDQPREQTKVVKIVEPPKVIEIKQSAQRINQVELMAKKQPTEPNQLKFVEKKEIPKVTEIISLESKKIEEKKEVVERDFPRRMPLIPKPTPVIQSPELKRQQKMSEDEMNVDEDDEDEDEEFDQLEQEARNICNNIRDEDSDTASGSGTPTREDEEEGSEVDNQDEQNTTTPVRKGILKKKRNFSRHSQMVVDKKYIKNKPKGKPPIEEGSGEEDEEEESAFGKESFVKRKNNMLKTIQEEGNFVAHTVIELEAIEKLLTGLTVDDKVRYLEKHMQILRGIWSGCKYDIQMLEKRKRLTEEKIRECRDRERQAKESISSPSQSTSSTAESVKSCDI